MNSATDAPTVVHVIAPGPAGGAESVARALVLGRTRAGRPTRLIAITEGESGAEYVDELRSQGAEVEIVPGGRRRYLKEIRLTETILKAARADIVHTHVYHANFVSYFAAMKARVPVVATYHGYVGGDLRNRVYEWLDRRLLSNLPAVVGVSERSVERLVAAGCRPDRVHLVRNAHDGTPPLDRHEARTALGLDQSANVIGWVGRLSHEKGPDLLLEALDGIGLGGIEVVVVGDGELRGLLQTGAARLAAQGVSVRLAGFRPDARTLHRAFDVLAITSRSENLPMAMIEAMASQTPIVTFDVGGIPEFLDQSSGWLAPAGDTDAFRAALQEALTDPVTANARADRALKVVRERAGTQQWIDAIESVYAAVSRDRSGAR